MPRDLRLRLVGVPFAAPPQGLLLHLDVLRDEGDPGVPRFQGMEAFAQVERDVLLLRCDGDPVALVISDLEPELLGVPFRRPLRVGYDQGDRGEAHHGNGIWSGPIRVRSGGNPHTSVAIALMNGDFTPV